MSCARMLYNTACLLRLSEAARLLGEDASRYAPAIQWRDVRGLGNRLRHEYQKVDAGLIWRIVEKDLLLLKQSTNEALGLLRRQLQPPG